MTIAEGQAAHTSFYGSSEAATGPLFYQQFDRNADGKVSQRLPASPERILELIGGRSAADRAPHGGLAGVWC